MKSGKEIAVFVMWIFKCKKHNSSTTIIKTAPTSYSEHFKYIFSLIFHSYLERKVLLGHLAVENTGT